jgi:tRNA nucleotidyltransferase (CCA-adding enzyme)
MDPQAVMDALAARADGAAVLALRGARVAVVGGFVRDVLLGREPREIDLLVEGDVRPLARGLGGEVTDHAAFLAAHVSREGFEIELTQARRERYAYPGALPQVEPASLEEDLPRRDFTVNALALTLDDGRLLAPDGALEDLAARRLRVFHDKSFIDDPTRVLRLARYAARLRFEVDPPTALLAAAARLDTVSGARIGGELRLIADEPDPVAALEAIGERLPVLVERATIERALQLAPPDVERSLVILAAVLRAAPPAWLRSLELTAGELKVIAAAGRAPAIAAAARAARTASELRDALRAVPAEAVAIAGALGASEAAARWLGELRHVELEIGGEDLLAAGIPAGPELGERLERTLRRKLDGELTGGRAAELESALRGPA